MEYLLQEYFCIYLDVLGYSDRIKNLSEDELNLELNNFIGHVGIETEFLKELGSIINFEIRVFSDNILIVLPATQETINVFHLILGDIIQYQTSLIHGNYFIRGGITMGKFYIDEKVIWGPALIEVVRLEKETEYPFISISNDIINLFVKNNLLNDTNDLLSVPIIEIPGNKYVLDYLQSTVHLTSGKPVTYYNFIPVHQSLIRHNLLTNKDDRILKKYNMLANYHNDFCNHYKFVFPDMMYFTIKESNCLDVIFKRKYLGMLL